MLELRHGHVVCINSILSLSSIPGAIDYCTSKASAYAFMESLTLGLLDCPGVDCTTILPFHTDTEMFQGMRVRYCSTNWPSGANINKIIWFSIIVQILWFNHFVLCLCRFPQLFPPLNPEMVAHRTVDAVRTNTAFVVLPWTMQFLVILKRLVF